MVVILKTGDRIAISQEIAERLFEMIAKNASGAKQWQFFTESADSGVIAGINLSEVCAIVKPEDILKKK